MIEVDVVAKICDFKNCVYWTSEDSTTCSISARISIDKEVSCQIGEKLFKRTKLVPRYTNHKFI